MPVKVLQRHVGGVRHSKVVTHLTAGEHRGIASFGDGHTETGGLIKGGELDDLSGKLQRLVEHCTV